MANPIETPAPDAARFHGAVPVFRVASLRASIDHYVTVLGFTVDFEGPGMFASVSRDRCTLFLCEGDQGHPGAWTWIGVSDADQVHAEYQRTGATIRNPPTNYPWAYEMQIADVDGNVLRLGSDVKTDRPTTLSPWRDMHGHVWVENPEGGFRRVEEPV
jgi:catechol 2,3-dioxygenase-like lactoylglutathione lyase family enzyme